MTDDNKTPDAEEIEKATMRALWGKPEPETKPLHTVVGLVWIIVFIFMTVFVIALAIALAAVIGYALFDLVI